MLIEEQSLKLMEKYPSFSKHSFYIELKQQGYSNTESSFLVDFQKLINDGSVQRVGRNVYRIANKFLFEYDYIYSSRVDQIAECIKENYPFVNFIIFETSQLNEFINHQIGKDTIFVFVENDAMDFVFDSLKSRFPRTVMLSPSIKEFHKYRDQDTIVISRLISESPKSMNTSWHICIEKLLVDIMADSLIKETFSKDEYKIIYELAFKKYLIDESKMFRYAKRRNVKDKIISFIKNETSVKLLTV